VLLFELQSPAWKWGGQILYRLAVVDNRNPIDQNMLNPHRKLMGIFVSGPVVNGVRVKNDQVGAMTFLNYAPTF
jgi:hypothetical protein